MENEGIKNGILMKLDVSENAEYPDSDAGNTPRHGNFVEKPMVGKGFYLETENGLFRTSFLVEILSETENEMVFKTNNSIYKLYINVLRNIE